MGRCTRRRQLPSQRFLTCTALLPNSCCPLHPQPTLQAASYQATPLAFSYWLSHNLPLQLWQRQELLQAPHAAQRLRQIIQLMQGLDRLTCEACHAPLATTHDILPLGQQGVGGIFVNAHGFVHDMVTFREVRLQTHVIGAIGLGGLQSGCTLCVGHHWVRGTQSWVENLHHPGHKNTTQFCVGDASLRLLPCGCWLAPTRGLHS